MAAYLWSERVKERRQGPRGVLSEEEEPPVMELRESVEVAKGAVVMWRQPPEQWARGARGAQEVQEVRVEQEAQEAQLEALS